MNDQEKRIRDLERFILRLSGRVICSMPQDVYPTVLEIRETGEVPDKLFHKVKKGKKK